MIRFACPRCKTNHQAPDEQAGVKMLCVGCGQNLQIPIAAANPFDFSRSPPQPPPLPPSAAASGDAPLDLPASAIVHEPLPPELPPPRRPRRKRDEDRPRSKAWSTWGIVLLGFGGCFVYRADMMDTTVPVPGAQDRVHNIGLMQNKQLMLILGLGLGLGGIICLVADHLSKRD